MFKHRPRIFDRARTALLPLSREKKDLKRAITEWRPTGTVNADEECSDTCGLCGHKGLRYQFQIRNTQNGNELWVGSECIRKFGIRGRNEDERELTELDTSQLLSTNRRRLVNEIRDRCVIKSLVELSAHDDEFDIDNFVTYWKGRGAFTPNQLALLFWRFGKYGIECERSYFKVSIRRRREKMQLLQMLAWKLDTILPALSASQRDLLRDCRPDLFECECSDDDVAPV